MSSLVALGCLWQGITMARAIGPELFYGDDASTSSYFAGLLDALAAFWDELGPAGQILMIATAAMLLMTRQQLAEYREFFTPLRRDQSLVRAIDMGILDLEGKLDLIDRDKAAVIAALAK